MALYEQMEEKDAHLYAVAHMRRLAVTGLPWQITSAAEVSDASDRTAADEAADYCREVLAGLDRFEEILQHLSLAMGRNVALAEIVWDTGDDGLRVVDVLPVPFDRLAFDAMGRPRILTKDEPFEGINLPASKFIAHQPHAVSGHPMRGGLLRVSALAYLGKHFAIKDWMVFSEVFGMPVRIARYDTSATPAEKRELLRMLQNMGADAVGIFSKAIELQFLEAGQGKAPPPYEPVCHFFNRELSKAWIGQTMTVDSAGTRGSLSIAQVHNEVRLDLRQDDIVKEGRTIRRDLLAPMARIAFGPDVPVPYFTRSFVPLRDQRELADVLNTAVNDLRMRVPARWAHEALGVPMASASEEVLTTSRPTGSARQ
jgi:phage gp29-like protein